MISDCVYLAILKNITVRLASRSCDVTFFENKPATVLEDQVNCLSILWFGKLQITVGVLSIFRSGSLHSNKNHHRKDGESLVFELNKYLPHFMTFTGHEQKKSNDIQPMNSIPTQAAIAQVKIFCLWHKRRYLWLNIAGFHCIHMYYSF